jgi:hypothetical protein
MGDQEKKKSKRDLLECQPNGGIHYYRFNGALLRFNVRHKLDEETTSAGKVVRVHSAFDGLQVSISYFSIWAGPGPVLAFLKYVESLHVAGQEFRTKIHQASYEDKDGWAFSIVDRPSRPLESHTRVE